MQQVFRDAMKIVKKEFITDKLQLVWSAVFMTYMGVATSAVMNVQFEHLDEYVNPLLDFLLVLYAPFLGFMFHRRSFRYINEDSYTQMLYYYRSLPVPASAIFVSRLINALIAFAVNSIVIYGIIYAIAYHIRSVMDIPAYIAFSLSWVGIGLFLTGFYIYWEYMGSGKAYLLNTFILMVITAGGAVVLSLLGYSAFEFIVNASVRWKLLSPVMWGSLIIGLAGMLLISRLAYVRQQTRDLS